MRRTRGLASVIGLGAIGLAIVASSGIAAAQEQLRQPNTSVEVDWGLLDQLGSGPASKTAPTRLHPPAARHAKPVRKPVASAKPHRAHAERRTAETAPKPASAKPTKAPARHAAPARAATATPAPSAPAATTPTSGPQTTAQQGSAPPFNPPPTPPVFADKPPTPSRTPNVAADQSGSPPPPTVTTPPSPPSLGTPPAASNAPAEVTTPTTNAPAVTPPLAPRSTTATPTLSSAPPAAAPTATPAPPATAAAEQPTPAATPSPAPRAAASAPAAPAQRMAALPSGQTEPGQIGQIPFTAGAADLPADGKAVLDEAATKLKQDDEARLQIVAYASGGDDSGSQARRLSLSRALAVRSYLIDQGVRSTRMDVRALGNHVPSGSADRVDILVVHR